MLFSWLKIILLLCFVCMQTRSMMIYFFHCCFCCCCWKFNWCSVVVVVIVDVAAVGGVGVGSNNRLLGNFLYLLYSYKSLISFILAIFICFEIPFGQCTQIWYFSHSTLSPVSEFHLLAKEKFSCLVHISFRLIRLITRNAKSHSLFCSL